MYDLKVPSFKFQCFPVCRFAEESRTGMDGLQKEYKEQKGGF